jgi:hypothetical protein
MVPNDSLSTGSVENSANSGQRIMTAWGHKLGNERLAMGTTQESDDDVNGLFRNQDRLAGHQVFLQVCL